MGATIGTVLISYDVNTNHNQVKNGMLELGYVSRWKDPQSSLSYTLPNTTLRHDNKSSDQAIRDIKRVCSNLGVTLERAVAVKASEFTGV